MRDKGHYDYISSRSWKEVIKENVFVYHLTKSKKKGWSVKVANGDIIESDRSSLLSFYEYSKDPDYKYCNKIYITTNEDGKERIDVAVLDEKDDEKAYKILREKLENEKKLIIDKCYEKIDALYFCLMSKEETNGRES